MPPWRTDHPAGRPGLIRIAREARGLTRPQLAAIVADLAADEVRAALALSATTHPIDGHVPAGIADRHLAATLDDAAILAGARALDEAALVALERGEALEEAATGAARGALVALRGGPVAEGLVLGALAAALGYPLHFFRQPNPARPAGLAWVCGTGIPTCHVCGFVADYQCDLPLGRGKRCDAHLCGAHAVPQGGGAVADAHAHFCPGCAVIAAGLVTQAAAPQGTGTP